MASGENSLANGSEPLYKFACSPCSKEGQHVEAMCRCNDCEEYFCTPCLTHHNKFNSMRDHSILNKDEMNDNNEQTGPLLPKERCSSHHGRVIDMFCGNHDIVCCATCIAISHRDCKDVNYLPIAAECIKVKQELKDVKASMNKILNRMKQLKSLKDKDLGRIKEERDEIYTQIQTFRQSIMKRLDELERKANDEIQSKFTEYEETLNADIDKYEECIKNLEKKTNDLSEFRGENDLQLFVFIKQGQNFADECNDLISQTEASLGTEELAFSMNDNILDYIGALENIGHLADLSPVSLLLHGKYYIKDSEEKDLCLTGCCLMEDCTILITDESNKSLKHLDSAYKVISKQKLPCRPSSICSVGICEVAITLFDDKKIQFATVSDQIYLTRSFNVGESCRGIAFYHDNLFVSCGGGSSADEGPGQVRVYSITGTLLKTFQTGSDGKNILSFPFGIETTYHGSNISIADRDNGMMTIGMDGNQKWRFTHDDLKHGIDVCKIDPSTYLVLDYKSDHIFQVGLKGKTITTLSTGKYVLKLSRSLCYDSSNKRLIVVMEDCSEIVVYQIKR